MSAMARSARLALSLAGSGLVAAGWACSLSGVDEPLIDTATSTPPPAVLFEEDFAEDTEEWTSGSDEISDIQLVDGVLDFVVKTENYLTWSNLQNERFEDIRVTVDVLDRSDTDVVGYAVVCNYRDSANFYYAGFSKDGYYIISKFENDEETVLSDPGGNWLESSAINAGNSQYNLEVVCAHDEIVLLVDGEEIASVADETFKRGEIGLMGISFDEIGLEFAFDNLRVERVDQGE
jgi:hypothetical protein